MATGDKSSEVRIWTKGKPGASKMWRSGQVEGYNSHLVRWSGVCSKLSISSLNIIPLLSI